jgi:hypothetical protein
VLAVVLIHPGRKVSVARVHRNLCYYEHKSGYIEMGYDVIY